MRRGIHTGPGYRVADINGRKNVAGGGMNICAECDGLPRVEANSPLPDGCRSPTSARRMASSRAWTLASIRVKHGVQVGIFNLFTRTSAIRRCLRKLKTQAADVNASIGTTPRPGTRRTKPPTVVAPRKVDVGRTQGAGSSIHDLLRVRARRTPDSWSASAANMRIGKTTRG